MERKSYERFGLTGNPFRDLASETIDHVDIFHVDLDVDKELKNIADEIIDKENKAITAILGGLGTGKTQRLILLSNMAKRKGLFYVFRTMTPETKWAVKGILDAIVEEIPLTPFEKYVNPPSWLNEIKKTSKRIKKGKGHDPVKTGKLVAEALNKKSPSFLLINDLQAIPKSKDLSDFIQTLYIIINNIEPGVMVAITSNKYFFDDLMKDNEAFDQRINKKLYLKNLNAREAEHLIAKRLLARRITDDLGLVYPFTKDSVKILNDEVLGNPRQVLRYADKVLEEASQTKSLEINDDFIVNFIKEQKGRQMLPPAPKNVSNTMFRGEILNPDPRDSKKSAESGKLPKSDTPPEAKALTSETQVKGKEKDTKQVSKEQDKTIEDEKEEIKPGTKKDRASEKGKELEKDDPKESILKDMKSEIDEDPFRDRVEKEQRKDNEKVIVKEKIVENKPKVELDLPSIPSAPSRSFISNSMKKDDEKENYELENG